MITSLQDHGRLPAERCDVCILGAGPAGITLALELARARPEWHIILLEGGDGSVPSADSDDAYIPAGDPAPYPLAATRLRFLGGTSNHWGGWCRPLDPIDFEARPWIPHSGWPLAHGDLAPFYRRAAAWCELASDDFNPDADLASPAHRHLELPPGGPLRHALFRFSPPTRFGQRYLEDLESTPNLGCWTHASAVGLEHRDGRVHAVRVANTHQLRGRLAARHVVVAMGGVENARFLLAQRDGAPADSGLASPMLGRCFADHLGFSAARALLPAQLDYSRREGAAGAVMPVLALSPEAQREHGLANAYVMPVPVPGDGGLGSRYAENRLFGFSGADAWHYRLQVLIEPQPNPESRIELSTETDRLGLPRLRLHWRMHPDDAVRGERLLDLLVAGLGAAGLGRLQRPAESGFTRTPSFVSHHMGSTRMAADPEGGVANADARVHGFENLHIAGSSLFPTFGYANPTLTLVALAVRLADHLAGGDGR